ncbi:MAG: ABC-ATPase domain-containing protein [Thermoleophilia bacterium]|nr:ABC-ATPase domain-containing protein [Thermoleophilia bacterium]
MDAARLKELLGRIDGRGYKAYREISGSYALPGFTLFIDYVQGDPFAAPSRLRAAVEQPLAGFDRSLYSSPTRRMALEDYLARAFDRAIRSHVRGGRGTGKSGLIAVDAGGQEILERTAAVVNDRFVEARFMAGLPASGRRCLGREAAAMLLEEVPRVVRQALFYEALDARELSAHIEAAEDQEWLRERLQEMRLVAFVADGSVLPRASGVSDLPLKGGQVVRFVSPPELKLEVSLPNRGRITGMGIPEGVTLVAGGGYHGKSTLLEALMRGVCCHIPGDGRELVVARADAVKIRAEDGRRVEKVNISPFISNLPFGVDTVAFSTENASGSTSQAANIVEALEAGARVLLMDEDTSATNFMIRDELMQRLIPKEKEPITPYIDQVQNLHREYSVSTILVMGGSGDYFEVVDNVIAMDNYLPRMVTEQARRIAGERRDARSREGGERFGPLVRRAPLAESIDPLRGGKERVLAREPGFLLFGRQTVDLSQVEQLLDISQTRAIGDMMSYARRRGYFDGRTALPQAITRVFDEIAREGLDVISSFPGADHALPRPFEVAAALNRLRSLKVKQIREKEM